MKRLMFILLIILIAVAGAAFASTLQIPASVKIIGDEAFYGDTSLDEVILPEGIEEIGVRAFAESSLKSIELPGSLKVIGEDALDSDVRVTAPEGSIAYQWADERGMLADKPEESPAGWFSFKSSGDGTCYLEKYIGPEENSNDIIIPARSPDGLKVVSIAYNAFKNCNGLTGTLILPEGVTSIADEALWGCGISCIRLPGSMEEIGLIFRGCNNLQNIFVDPSNRELSSVGGVLYDYNKTQVIACPSGKTGYLSIPESVSLIKRYAFFRSQLRILEIPEGCAIEAYAFSGFNKTGSIILPGSSFVYQSSWPAFLDNGTYYDSIIDSDINNLVIPGSFSFDTSYSYASNHWFSAAVYGSINKLYISDGSEEMKLSWIASGKVEDLYVPSSVTTVNSFQKSNVARIHCVRYSHMWNWCDSHGCEDKLIEWDGVIRFDEENLLTGCFMDQLHVLTPGDKIIPSGFIASSRDDIHRVTITIDGWNQDGTNNNRYATFVCDDLHTKKINLTDLDAFYLDTNVEPLNIPGEYTINLWASTVEGEGVKLDSMTVVIADLSEFTISGEIKTESGEPIRDVNICMTNTNDASDTRYTYSRADGTWNIRVNRDTSYIVSYSHYQYEVSGDLNPARGNDYLTAIAVINGNIDNTCTFEMKNGDGSELPVQNGVPYALVNSDIVFNVTAPGCSQARLVVDGKAYESWELDNNGTIEIHRAFTLSKDNPRKVKFQVMKIDEYVYTDFTLEQDLLIKKNDTLSQSIIHPIDTYCLDSSSPLTIDWEPVNHATGYKVYLYYDGIRFFPHNDESDRTYTSLNRFEYSSGFPTLFDGDLWTVDVVAIGEEGWSSSTSTSTAFEIVKTNETVSIMAPKDHYQAEVEERIFVELAKKNPATIASIEVIGPSGMPLSPDDITEDSEGYYVHFTESGEHIIRVLLSETICDSITVNVKEPEVVSFYESKNRNQVIVYKHTKESDYAVLSFQAKLNFVPTKVAIKCNGLEYEPINNDLAQWEFMINDIIQNSEERNTYQFIAYYGNNKAVLSDHITVYTLVDNNTEARKKTKKNIPLLKSPDGSSEILTNIEINSEVSVLNGTYGGYVSACYNNLSGFVLENDIVDIDTELGLIDGIVPQNNFSHLYTGESMVFYINTNNNLNMISAVAKYYDFNAYWSGGECIYEEILPVTNCGIGSFAVTVVGKRAGYARLIIDTGENTQESVEYKSFEFAVLDMSNDNSIKYLSMLEYTDIFDSAYEIKNRSAINTIQYDEPFVIDGVMENDLWHVTANENEIEGFMQPTRISDSVNPETRRGYCFMSAPIYDNEWDWIDNKGEWNPIAGVVGVFNKEQFVNQTRQVFSLGKCKEQYIYKVTCSDLIGFITQTLPDVTDFNDVTYIIVWSHGSPNNGCISLDDRYYYHNFIHDLRGINGHVVLIMIPCGSGGMVDMLQKDFALDAHAETLGLDRNRYTVLASAGSEEKHWYDVIYGSYFLNAIIEKGSAAVGSSSLTKGDIASQIEVIRNPVLGSGESHPQYYGSINNIVFPQR